MQSLKQIFIFSGWLLLGILPLLGQTATHGILRLAPGAEDKFLRASGIDKLAPLGEGRWVVSLTPDSPLQGKLEPISLKQKLSEELQGTEMPKWAEVRLRGDVEGLELLVYYHRDSSADHAQSELDSRGYQIVDRSDAFGRITVRIPKDDLKRLAAQDWVWRVEPTFAPMELRTNVESARQLRVTELHEGFGLTGTGARVAVVDGQVEAHPEFGDRLTQFRSAEDNFHGTHVAGTVAAAGLDPDLKGMAPAARITSYGWRLGTLSEGVSSILSSTTTEQHDLATNSWGAGAREAFGTCGLMGTYSSFDREVDRIVAENNYSVVFAVGNTRDQYDCNMFARAGFYTLPPPGAAKNIVTVGAVDRENATSTFSSFGPTRDGRLKPDVVALGVGVRSTALFGSSESLSGTSMAAPAVSGLAALLVDRYRQKHAAKPEPELLKAILANTAKDLGNPGPDYSYGYGIPDGVNAVAVIDEDKLWRESVASGETKEFDIQVPDGAPAVRVMLAWTDPPAAFGATRALLHDLDLSVLGPDGEARLPLTLDPFNPAADAAPGENHLDNTEQVVVASPAGGTWKVRVKANELPFNAQRFAVVWTVAENPAPPCTTTVFPSTLFAGEAGGTAAIQVARSSTCEPWGVAELPDWITHAEPSTNKASATAKLRLGPNESGQQRLVGVKVAGKEVVIRQNTKCVAQDLPVGELVNARLDTTDCSFLGLANFYAKHFKFKATRGQRIIAEANSFLIDTYIVLEGPNGIYIGEDDDGGVGLDSRLPANDGSLTLPIDGEYTLIVSSALSRQTGSFAVRVTLGDPEGPESALPKVIEACPAEITGTLGEGSSTAGRRGDLYRTDVYLFEGRVGQELAASVPESAFDAVLYLISPTGAQLALADDAQDSSVPTLKRVLTANGVYKLEVSSYAPFGTGDYKLQVQNCSEWVRP
ncbi:MAG: S8 family serine peptidase [Bryobacter sp.]|nr:S8 family serine peptidase [Bryobacter sp.]